MSSPDTAPAPPLRDAATVIIARPAVSGFEVFMVRRSRESSFMPSIHVYPGGALDPQDCEEHVLAHITGMTADEAGRRLGMPDEPMKAVGLFLAGVRESFEEAGFLLAKRAGEEDWIDLTSDPEVAARFEGYRARLNAYEMSMAQLLEEEDLYIPIDKVGYFARWITPFFEKKRFDARFFVTYAPKNQRPLHDDREATQSEWIAPSVALARYVAGEFELAPPTISTLTRLARFGSVMSLERAARTYNPPALLPHFMAVDDAMTLVLPGDSLYPTDDERYAIGGVGSPWTRMVSRDGTWEIVTRDHA